jgi:glutathione S-transferase
MELTLYYAPFTCAGVTLSVLEESEIAYQLTAINLQKGENYGADYLGRVPTGKVPALEVDGRILTETPAIMTWLNATYPDKNIMPTGATGLEQATLLSDLCFCSGTVHPIVTRIARAAFLCETEDGAASVYALACKAMALPFARIESQLNPGPWWYGDRFSAMDYYINWIWQRVTSTPFDQTPYPRFQQHAAMIGERPAAKRVAQIVTTTLAEMQRPAFHK